MSTPSARIEIDVEEISDSALIRKQREVQALLAWANTFLSKRALSALSLYSFDDGVLLINLVEVAFSVQLPKYHNRPKLPFHKLENVSICLDYLEKQLGTIMVSVDANDIVSRKDKQITVVLWNILRTHLLGAIKQESGEKDINKPANKQQTIKDKLLAWCSDSFQGSNIVIKDFWESFKSGQALAAIVNKLHPGAIEEKDLANGTSREILTRAIAAAEKHLGIPALLEATDFESTADEGSVVNYVSMLLSASHTSAKARELADKLENEKQLREQEQVLERQRNEEINRMSVSRQAAERRLYQEKCDEVAKLTEQLETVSKQLSEVKQNYNQLEIEKQRVEEQVQEEQKKIEKTEEKAKEIQIVYVEQIKKVETQNATAEKQNKENLITIQQLEVKQVELESEITRWKTMLDSASDTATVHKELAEDNQRKAELMKQEYEHKVSQQKQNIQENIESHKKEIQELEIKMTKSIADEKDIIAARDKEIDRINTLLAETREKNRADLTKFNAEQAKMENIQRELEQKLRDMTEQRDSKDEEIVRLSSDLTQRLEKLNHAEILGNKLKQELLENQNKFNSLKDETQNTISSLNAEVYGLHKELEEIVERVRAEEKAKTDEKATNKYSDLLKRRRDSVFIQQSIREVRDAKYTAEALNHMKPKGGFLMRRRPFAVFNAKRFKQVFFRVRGEVLEYGKDEKSLKPVKLKEYGPGQVKSTLPGQFVFRLAPLGIDEKSAGNVTFDFMAMPNETDPTDNKIKQWLYEINRRIVLTHYLHNQNDKNPAIPELVKFLSDDKSTQLTVVECMSGVPEALHALNPALQYRMNLRLVELCNVNLTDKDMNTIAELLKENHWMTHLDLSHNLITELGAHSLSTVLAVANTTLKSLIMDNNQLKDEGAKKLSSCLPSHTKLQELSLVANQLTDNAVISLCNDLLSSEKKTSSNHYFPEIRLRGNRISDNGAMAIANLLKRNTTIASINLESNSIGDVGAVALVSSSIDPAILLLNDNPSTRAQLNSINLSHNQLSSKSLIQFADILKQNPNELALDLSHNKLITRTGVKALVGLECKMDYPLLKLVKKSDRVEDEDEEEEETNSNIIEVTDVNKKNTITGDERKSAAPSNKPSREHSLKNKENNNNKDNDDEDSDLK